MLTSAYHMIDLFWQRCNKVFQNPVRSCRILILLRFLPRSRWELLEHPNSAMKIVLKVANVHNSRFTEYKWELCQCITDTQSIHIAPNLQDTTCINL